MLYYTNEQLAAVIAIPIITVLLCWTTVIFHKNRKHWGPYDISIIAILILSIIRNVTVLIYIITLILIVNQHYIFATNLEYCSLIIWLFNSIHTFQASSLTTLAVIGLFSMKLHKKQQNLKQFLTSTHIIYHLFCLTTLCACVGVAAILAQSHHDDHHHDTTIETRSCKFMPFNLDIKYNVFIIVLHIFLASVSFISFLIICFNYYQIARHRTNNNFDYLNKSSDASDLSTMKNNNNVYGSNSKDNENFYDTYTIHRNPPAPIIDSTYYHHNDTIMNGQHHHHHHNGWHNRGLAGGEIIWTSDVSNISTTVSSTNSRRPCIVPTSTNASNTSETTSTDAFRTGLETIHPILIVCYLFYHLPLIILCINPTLIAPWPVAGLALWLGLIQDLLIPIGLSLVDSRFAKWVSNVYRCSDKHGNDKLPHVGLDGKFRPFGSQPQSLVEINSQQQLLRGGGGMQVIEHRFPLTNGSLYTSVDGRMPVIHNYRRHKDFRGQKQSSSSSDFQQQLKQRNNLLCLNCENDLCTSHSNLHHLTPHYINKQLNLIQQQQRPSSSPPPPPPPPPVAVTTASEIINKSSPIIMNSTRNLVSLSQLRLCKSDVSLDNFLPETTTTKTKSPNNAYSSSMSISSSDDDDDDDDNNTINMNGSHQNFDTLSTQSTFSITTEANGDFEFYQNDDSIVPKAIQTPSASSQQNFINFKIKRSNSKRSLENFQAFIEQHDFSSSIINNDFGGNNNKIQRSNSFMTLEDRRRKSRRHRRKLLLLRSDSKLSDCTYRMDKQKIKSVEYLPTSNASTVFIEDYCYFNYPQTYSNDNKINYVGSVPDFKKVFISEYI